MTAVDKTDAIADDLKDITQDGAITEEEKGKLAKLATRLHEVVTQLEDKTKFTSLLELFNLLKLEIITELDKAHIDTITKFETYVESQKLLYGFADDDDDIPSAKIVHAMIDSLRTNMISFNRKSRKEVVEVLKDSYSEAQAQRNVGRLLR